MLISMATILKDAKKNGYGVAAPNVFDGESVRVCFEAAKELHAPMIIDAGGVDPEYIGDVVRFYCKRYPEVPVALNLDHGDDLKQVVEAIRAGFSSVMIDSSTAPFEENVAITSEVVKVAHSVGISVEAELGHVGLGNNYAKDGVSHLTLPEEAVEFVKQTGIDCLAVAIGTAHGPYNGVPKLDIERLDAIREAVPVPLVLHGGSSTGDENLQNAIHHGISKVNLGTDLAMAGSNAVRKLLKRDNVRLGAVAQFGIEGYKAELMRYLNLFGEKDRW